MGKTKKAWSYVVIPFSWFRMGTKNGGVIFQIEGGELDGFQFVRPLVLVRRSFDKGNVGFKVSYSIEQELDDNDDIVGEKPEELELRRSEKKKDGSYEVVEQAKIDMSDLEDFIE